MQEGPFLGSHREEVTYLEQRLNALVAGENLKPIVLLEAPSGYGKSRIVREFYSKLADSQEYWPNLPSPESDPMSLRKVIGPDMAGFVWEAGALPTFTWWSFNCEELASGGALDVIGAARSQWEDHRVPVAMAVDNIHSRGASAARWKQRGTAAMNRVFSEGASLATDALIEAAGLTFPGARALLDWGRDAVDAVSEHQHRENQLHSRVDLGSESAQRRHDEATSFAEVVRGVTRPELPTVIVVEDTHLMTPELAEFLNRVTAEPVLPVLVVATAWPGAAGRPVYARWLADAEGLIETRTVQGLTPQQRERLVSVHAPGTPRETCAAIAAQLTTPLAIKLWLALPPVRRHQSINRGALNPTEDDISELPTVMRSVHDARWNELSPTQKLSLALVSAISPLQDPLRAFLPDVVARVVNSLTLAGLEHVAGEIEALVTHAHWCRRSSGVQMFVESSLVDCAARNRPTELLHADVVVARELALKEVFDFLESQRDGLHLPETPETLLAAQWYDGWTTDDQVQDQLWLSVQELLARVAGQRHNYAEAIDRGKRALRLMQGAPREALPFFSSMATQVAEWQFSSGDREEALSMVRAMADTAAATYGNERHPQVLLLHGQVARFLAGMGQREVARQLQLDVVAGLTEVLGPDHVLTRREAISLGSFSEGSPADARDYQDAVDVGVADGAFADAEALIMQLSAAEQRARAGDASAIDTFQALLSEYEQLPECSTGELIISTNQLARLLMQHGRFDQAIPVLTRALAKARAEYTATDPTVLTIEMNLGVCYREVGDTASAAETLSRVYRLRASLFGPDDHQTLTSQLQLGQAQMVNGDRDAVDTLTDVVQRRNRVSGPTAKETLLAKRTLYSLLYQLGYDSALESLYAVYRAQCQLLSPEHPHAKNTLLEINLLTQHRAPGAPGR